MNKKKLYIMSLIVIAVAIVVGCICYYVRDTKQVYEGTFICLYKLFG